MAMRSMGWSWKELMDTPHRAVLAVQRIDRLRIKEDIRSQQLAEQKQNRVRGK